ncbi:histidine kinase dimerization/phospho-acceptor domain-containing protein [Paracoccus sediminilitoris]|uniref:histidine kinase dimerization/phospho-acceptor domain-containing protein n=1 Tax=Paracoccus sediminilitoris TaxID=2202419 RepID=UPI000DBA14A6|nr:histidine kinase dimerization/phospho-acceptor domain-containing protein [Paracoccus sediminilitoris]
METKVPQIDAARLQIQAHLRSGQRAEAMQVFNTEIYRQLELFEEAAIRKLRERSEALVASNDRLRSVDASRANFFTDISHELRTPLTILRGQAEMATRAADADADAGVMRHALGDIVQGRLDGTADR